MQQVIWNVKSERLVEVIPRSKLPPQGASTLVRTVAADASRAIRLPQHQIEAPTGCRRAVPRHTQIHERSARVGSRCMRPDKDDSVTVSAIKSPSRHLDGPLAFLDCHIGLIPPDGPRCFLQGCAPGHFSLQTDRALQSRHSQVTQRTVVLNELKDFAGERFQPVVVEEPRLVVPPIRHAGPSTQHQPTPGGGRLALDGATADAVDTQLALT